MCAAASWHRSSTVVGRFDAGHQLADRRIQLFQRTWLARNRCFQLDQQIGGGAMHQQLMPAVVQRCTAPTCTAADRGLLEQRLEGRQHATEYLTDVLHQRFAELLQQPRLADGALTHPQ
jgi:hypothetical protein